MLLIDPDLKQAVRELTDDWRARLPELSIGGVWPLTVALVKRIRQPWNDLLFAPRTPASWTLRAAIGGFKPPTAGTFTLLTDDEIGPDPTDADIEEALNADTDITAAGGVTVAGEAGYFVITWLENGARDLLTGDAADLVPVSTLEFKQAVAGDADTREVQTLRILQNVGALITLAVDSIETSPAITVLQQGDGTHNHKVRVTLPDNLWGGAWTLSVNGAESPNIDWNLNAALVQIWLQDIAGVGAGNVAVYQDTETSYVVTFTGTLGNQAVTLAADGSGLLVVPTFSGLLDCRGPGMEYLFDSDELTAVATFEMEWQDGIESAPQKILSEDILLVRPVITPESSLPSDTGNTGGISANEAAAIVEGYSGSDADLVVNTAGTSALAPSRAFSQWFLLVTAQAGAGAYTRILTLATTHPIAGAIYRVEIDLEASANPTIEIRNGTAGGTLLATAEGDPDNARYFVGVFRYDGNAWHPFSTRYET